MQKIDFSMGNVADSVESSFKREYLNEYEAKNEMVREFQVRFTQNVSLFILKNLKLISLSFLFKKTLLGD